MNDELIEKRLERMEAKMDTLVEVMVSLARAEEKILNVLEKTREIEDRVDYLYDDLIPTHVQREHMHKVTALEKQMIETQQGLTVVQRLVYGVVGLILTAVIGMGLTNLF